MSNFISMLDVAVSFCDTTSWSAWFVQLWYLIQTGIYRVLGLFADLLNIAFYIFSGVDISSTEMGSDTGIYDIEVGYGSGVRKNILDYFLFSETMTKAYMWLAIIGLLLVVIFTIYKIIKQDYFEKAGPRSKGPIFRNVAISCISFLLVIPIFYLIIHASSILAIAVMDAMGMDASQFAGAKIFSLSWSDGGKAMYNVNAMLISDQAQPELKWMQDLQWQTMFAMLANGKYVWYDSTIISALGISTPWLGKLGNAGIIGIDGEPIGNVDFFWYIYLVGVVVGIKNLYMLIKAMIQRIFMLMGLFLVAPSPISQYVLDDGQKFKNWLSQSIQQGLRLVVATMSFSIFLIALSLIGQINFVAAFNSAIDSASQTSNYNVSTDLLVYNQEPARASLQMLANAQPTFFEKLVNAFLQILLLMGAGGAITDLDGVLTPLISGGKNSLDAGMTGKGVDSVKDTAVSVAKAGVGIAAGAAGAIAGSVIGGMAAGIGDSAAGDGMADGMADEATGASEMGADGVAPEGPTGGDSGGGSGGGDNNGTSTATEVSDNAQQPENNGGEGEGQSGDATPPEGDGAPEGGEEAGEATEGGEGEGQPDDATPPEGDGAPEGGEEAGEATEGGEGEGQSDDATPPEGDGAPEGGEQKGDAAGSGDGGTNSGAEKDSESEASGSNGGTSNAGQSTQKSSSGGTPVAGSKLAAAQNKIQNQRQLKNRNKRGLKHLPGKILRGAGRAAMGAGMGIVSGVLKGSLNALKNTGLAILKPVKSLLGTVGIDADQFGKTVASSYKGTRDAGRKSQKRRYENTKAATYNELRQARLEDAQAVNEQNGTKFAAATEKMENAVQAEEQAGANLQEASGNAAVAASMAAEANSIVDNDPSLNGAENVVEAEKLSGEIDELQHKNDAITNKYGSEEKMKRDMADAKESNPNKYKEISSALKKYNANKKKISTAQTALDELQPPAKEMIDTFSGRNSELADLGITAGMKFEEAKAIVESKGSVALKGMFDKPKAKEVFENANVQNARDANSEVARTSAELETATTAYVDAHESRMDVQKEFTETSLAFEKTNKVVDSLGESILEDNKAVIRPKSKYERDWKKTPKASVSESEKETRRQAASPILEENKKIAKRGAKVAEAAKGLNEPTPISSARQMQKFAQQKVEETRTQLGIAEGALDSYVHDNSNVRITDPATATPTTLGDYVKKSGGSVGTALSNLQGALPPEEKGKVFNSELGGLMQNYKVAQGNHTRAVNNQTHATNAISAMSAASTMNERKMANIQTQYAETVERGKVIERVIAMGPNQAQNVTADDRRVIGETLGLRGGMLRATTGKTIVERAKEASAKNSSAQADLMKRANEVKADNTKTATEMKAVLDSLIRAAGAKPQPAAQGQSGQTVQNIVNNNTTNNNGGSGIGGRSSPADASASTSSPFGSRNANDVASSMDTTQRMERMQMEQMRQLESMMQQMMQENKAIMEDVREIKDKIDIDE